MIKRTMTLIMVAIIVTGYFAVAMAADQEGNYRKGKYLFRQSCRACHVENGKAKVLEPLTFTMDEWTKVFAPDKRASYKCQEEWSKMSEVDVKDIYSYVHKFAKDSPTPASCK